MLKEIDNEMFVKEMKLLWQNALHRTELGWLIRHYFGNLRAEPIINKLQEKI